MALAIAICSAALFAGDALAAEGIEFDVSAFEKKPFEWSGYLELKPEYQWLDRGSALYGLLFPNETRAHIARTSTAAEISGVYRHGDARFNFTGHASYLDDPRGSLKDSRFYEAYGAWQPTTGVAVEAGKRTLRWGKGYAWSPVAFFERPRDPTDPELSREGFGMATGSVVRSFPGPLATLSFTPLVVPVGHGINEDYGPGEHWNPGARLYALFHDTDIDLLYAGEGSRGARAGADFSRNLGTNLEIHGEWAHVSDAPRVVLTAANTLANEVRSYSSYVLGLRYLSEAQATLILEYYRNGGGYTQDEAQRFYEFARLAAGNPALRPIAAQAANAGFVGPNPMREYLYLRVSQPEPFDILYFTPALTAIVNAEDRSYTLIPEFLYTRITNLEMRLRLQLNRGAPLTEFGEKAVDSRVELRLRYFF
jgi:hypothetical protein